MNTNTSMISLREVYFSYSKKKILLNRLNIDIKKGMVFCLVGPNGAGKSTTLKLISGLEKCSIGLIEINGKLLTVNKQEILKNMFIAIDSSAFYNNLTGYENLEIICKYRNLNPNVIKTSLEKFGLKNGINTKYKEFSYGMKQRLTLSAGSIFKPKLMILDEPFNGIDPTGVVMLRNYILELNNDYGTTFLISSHFLREVGSFCSHYGILNNGSIIETGSIGDDIEEFENIYISAINKYQQM